MTAIANYRISESRLHESRHCFLPSRKLRTSLLTQVTTNSSNEVARM